MEKYRLKELRLEHGLTVKGLALYLGISEKTYRSKERESGSTLWLDEASKLAMLYGIKITDLKADNSH